MKDGPSVVVIAYPVGGGKPSVLEFDNPFKAQTAAESAARRGRYERILSCTPFSIRTLQETE